MTVKNHVKDFERTKHMVFVEFLEYICRIAYCCTISIHYEYESNASEKEDGFLSPNVLQVKKENFMDENDKSSDEVESLKESQNSEGSNDLEDMNAMDERCQVKLLF